MELTLFSITRFKHMAAAYGAAIIAWLALRRPESQLHSSRIANNKLLISFDGGYDEDARLSETRICSFRFVGRT